MYRILFLAVFLFACKTNSTNAVVQVQEETNAAMTTLNSDDCYKDRKTEKSIDNIEGSIMIIGGEYYLNCEGYKRYQPCNLPEKFKKEGAVVKFNGDVKEIFAHERRAGTPLVLTMVK